MRRRNELVASRQADDLEACARLPELARPKIAANIAKLPELLRKP